MSITYENVAYDRVLKGVEKILEAEFKDEVFVYLSDEYEDYPDRKSIRLWNLPSEQIARETASVTDLFPVEITCYVPVSQISKRRINDEMAELTAKVKRLLNNNRTYRPDGVYKWHDGVIGTEPTPDRDEDTEVTKAEPNPDVMSMSRIIFNVTVTEVFA